MFLRNLTAATVFILFFAGPAHADLDVAIQDLNISAEGNIGDFKTRLGVRFGAGEPRLDLVLRSVDRPADAAIILWIGECTGQPMERILKVYRNQKGNGWGAVAKSLGIKPGSAAFHALKRGDLEWRRGGSEERGKGKEKKKGNGKNKWG